MAQKMIYLTDELLAESKNISNFSELIQRLFKDYLQIKKSKSELIREAEKINEDKMKIIKEAEKEESKIIIQVKQIEDIEKQTIEEEEKRRHKFADKISNVLYNAQEIYDIVLTPAQAEEYLKDEGNVNLYSYLLKKDLIKRTLEIKQENKE